MDGIAARLKTAVVIAITLAALALSVAGCGGNGSSGTQPATQGGRQGTTLTPQQRARALGKKVEQFQQQEQRKTQKNLQQYQQGKKKCPPGQSYAPQLDICI